MHLNDDNIKLLHHNTQEAVDFTVAVYSGLHSGALISAFTHEKPLHAQNITELVLNKKSLQCNCIWGFLILC